MGAVFDSGGRVRFDDIDSTYEWSSVEELAADYWRWQRLPSKEQALDPMAASLCIGAFMAAPDPQALRIIDALLGSAADKGELCAVGAGPLEDLLSHYGHGRRFASEVEARARHSSRLRQALSCLWLSDTVPAEVKERLGPPGKWQV